MRFMLGTSTIAHLARPETKNVPLFVARPRLARAKKLPHRPAGWAPVGFDSGAYSHAVHGQDWDITPRQYAAEMRRYIEEIGATVELVAPMDRLCTPRVLKAMGRTVRQQQDLSLRSYLDLMQIDPELPWSPIIHGWTGSDFRRHVDAHYKAGVELHTLERVGVGSLAERQHHLRPHFILAELARQGIRTHAFGYKYTGLKNSAPLIASADSQAWVANAAKEPPLPDCTHRHCTTCLPWALGWRENLLAAVQRVHPDLESTLSAA